MKITQELLRAWNACDDGFQHFMDHWPEGAEYEVIQESLRKDGKHNWYQWLTNKVWSEIVADPSNIGALVTDEVTLALSATKGSPNVASGKYSTAASSGWTSTAASSGEYSKVASSGEYSTAAASGKNTIAMVAGLHGQAKAGENGCIALCWHDGTRNRIVTGYVGEDIKADTLYHVRDGKLVEVST